MYNNTHTYNNTTATATTTTTTTTTATTTTTTTNNNNNDNNIYIARLKAEFTVLWQTSKSKKLSIIAPNIQAKQRSLVNWQ